MAIRKGQVVKVMEGRDTLMAMINTVRGSSKKKGFRFSIVEDDGLRRSAFDPDGEIVDTGDAIMVNGREFGSDIPARLLIFKNNILDSEIGSIIVA